MKKLVVAFRDFANAPQNVGQYNMYSGTDLTRHDFRYNKVLHFCCYFGRDAVLDTYVLMRSLVRGLIA